MSKDVFFLGSGFSKAIDPNYETLEGLSSKIIQNLRCEKGSVKEHLINEVPKQYLDNIELLLTYLQSKLPYKTDVQKAEDEALYIDIVNNIARHFYSKKNNFNYHENNNINGLIKYICKNKLTCITLNYDLLLEKLISSFLPPVEPSNRLTKSISYYKMPLSPLIKRGETLVIDDSDNIENLPTILKLHGSINWLDAGITQTDTVYCTPDTDYNIDEIRQWLPILSLDLQPMIVPPVLDKTSSYGHILIQTLWQEAYKKLQKADNIYVYGFSFPPTDLSVRYLFQSALSNNHKSPQIFVINTLKAVDNTDKKNYCKDRYEEIFKGFNPIFDYCCDNSLEKFVQEVIEPKLEVVNAN